MAPGSVTYPYSRISNGRWGGRWRTLSLRSGDLVVSAGFHEFPLNNIKSKAHGPHTTGSSSYDIG